MAILPRPRRSARNAAAIGAYRDERSTSNALDSLAGIPPELFPDLSRHGDVSSRIGAVLAWDVASLAEEIIPIGPGWVARTRSLPLVRTLNQVHLRERLSAREVVSVADEHQGDLSYRHVRVDDEGTAAAMERWNDGRGHEAWRSYREVFMALTAPALKEAPATGMAELGEDEMLRLMCRWELDEQHDHSTPALGELTEYYRREGRLWDEQVLGVRDEHGRALAVTKYRSRNGVAWVEDVYTVPEARGRGYARMLVTQAAERARADGRELAFIVADDNDWPKRLYADIGFRPVGYSWIFHRDVLP